SVTAGVEARLPPRRPRPLDSPKGRPARGPIRVGFGDVQEDSLAGRVQVPRGRLLRERGGSVLPLPGPRFGADPGHGPRPDARGQRRALHRPCRPLPDLLLPRFHPKVEKPFDPLSGDGGRGTRDLTPRLTPDRYACDPRPVNGYADST